MKYSDLRDFIAQLEALGELKRIAVEVDPHLEMTEIADRVLRAGGPALLFEKPKGHSMPVLVNLFGTPRRVALGIAAAEDEDSAELDWKARLREVGTLLSYLKEPEPPKGLKDAWDKLPVLKQVLNMAPKVLSSGPCQDVVWQGEDVDLGRLPVQTCWPGDAAPLITWGLVVTRGPQKTRQNLGIYRQQLIAPNKLIMRWLAHRGGALDYREHCAAHPGEPFPVAVVIGADPATILAAVTPVPDSLSEYQFAGLLRGAKTELVKCLGSDLQVPASAEIVLEGVIHPDETAAEGPFGDHTGYYSLPEPYPVFHVTAITHRRNPIYLTTIVGKPPMEDLWLGKTTERAFLPILRKMVPEIVDMNFPAEGIFNNGVIVSIKKTYPGQARKVAHALWGLGQMSLTKVIILVDEWVNVQNLSEVAWLAFMNIDPKRDCFFVEGPVDTLNHASPEWNFGSKMGIDATTKLPEEGHTRGWPDLIEMSPEMKAQVTRRWAEYGI